MGELVIHLSMVKEKYITPTTTKTCFFWFLFLFSFQSERKTIEFEVVRSGREKKLNQILGNRER